MELHRAVLGIFQSHTFYPEESLRPESELEGDLGIDSVVLQSIVADIRRAFSLAPSSLKLDGFRTIQDVIDRVRAESGGAAPPAAPEKKPAAASGTDPILEIVERHTQYPRAQLQLDAQLEGDLGIDSVVLQSILTDVSRALGLAEGTLSSRSFTTLRELVEAASAKGAPLRPTSDIRVSSPRTARPIGAPVEAPRPARPTSGVAEPPKPVRPISAPVEVVRAPPPRPASSPARATGLSTALREELAKLLRVSPESIPPGTSFLALGLSAVQQAKLREAVLRRLGIEPALKLEECDTLDKLERFAAAAAPHGVAKLDGKKDPSAVPVASANWDGRSMKDFVEEPSPDLFAKVRSFNAFFKKRQSENLFWYGMPLHSACKNRAIIYDEVAGKRREFLMFASNNYLGLANHPHVIDAITRAYKEYGATNTGCRLIGGTNHIHKELERRLARFKGTEACIIYPSGYSANLGTISALVKRNDAVIIDKYNHMSIVDGCKLSGGQRRIYAHNDMRDLERVLQGCEGKVDGKLIVTDGVFSMHGNVCDAPEIVRLARKYGARVLIDDAHSTGVLGRRGSGTAEHFGLQGGKDVDLELGTMSKTLAGLGGFVCGDEDVVDYLRFYANSYVFAANIPAGVAAGLIASIDLIENEPQRVTQLWENIHLLQGGLESFGFDTGGASSAIVPIVIGDDRKCLEYGRAVRARGLFCQTVVYPGVSVGDARLRISVSSEHTREDLEQALEIFVDAAKEVGVFPSR